MIVEDVDEVRHAIIQRMKMYTAWECSCDTAYFEIALKHLNEHKPELLFLDYSILGGNSFMLLEHLLQVQDYDPYIIFFTGYMSDQPEIAEQILNKYHVDKFLNKPIFQKLTNQLDSILAEAFLKNNSKKINQFLWIETIEKLMIQINPELITCFYQSINPRYKVILLVTGVEYEIKASWSDCEKIVVSFNLNFEYANSRYYYINKKHIIKKKRPFLWLTDGKKVEVTKEKWNKFIA
ncbi:MAG: response regulator [Fluviicola sp.]|nr:response regulator [Fluviicola sp.]